MFKFATDALRSVPTHLKSSATTAARAAAPAGNRGCTVPARSAVQGQEPAALLQARSAAGARPPGSLFGTFSKFAGGVAQQFDGYLPKVAKDGIHATGELAARLARMPGEALNTTTSTIEGYANGVLGQIEQAFFSADPEEDQRDIQRARALCVAVLEAAGRPEAEVGPAMREALSRHPEAVQRFLQRRATRQFLKDADIELPPMDDQGMLSKVASYVPEGTKTAVAWSLMVRSMSPAALKVLLSRLPDHTCRQFAGWVNQMLERTKLSDLEVMKKIRDPKVGIDFTHIPEKMRKLAENVLIDYFDQLPLEEKRKLAIPVLQLEAHAPLSKQMAAVLQNLDPGLQKLFQLIGHEAKSPVIKDAMKELLDNVKPLDWTQVDQILHQELGRDPLEFFRTFRQRHLAAGTVGQVHEAVVSERGVNRAVVVKVLRPNLEAPVKATFATLETLTRDPYALDILASMKSNLRKELNLAAEASQMEKAYKVYHKPEVGLDVVRVIKSVPVTPSLLVMTKAPGRGIDKWDDASIADAGLSKEEFLRHKADALSTFFGHWFYNAVFGDGFFDADRHPGNAFLDIGPQYGKDGEIGHRMTIFDIGSSATLLKGQRDALKMIGQAIVRNDYGQRLLESNVPLAKDILQKTGFDTMATIIHGIDQLKTLSSGDEALLRERIAPLLETADHPVKKIADILTLTVDLGIKLPDELLQFNRGRMFLEQQLDAVGRAMDWEQLKLDLKRRWPSLTTNDLAAIRGREQEEDGNDAGDATKARTPPLFQRDVLVERVASRECLSGSEVEPEVTEFFRNWHPRAPAGRPSINQIYQNNALWGSALDILRSSVMVGVVSTATGVAGLAAGSLLL